MHCTRSSSQLTKHRYLVLGNILPPLPRALKERNRDQPPFRPPHMFHDNCGSKARGNYMPKMGGGGCDRSRQLASACCMNCRGDNSMRRRNSVKKLKVRHQSPFAVIPFRPFSRFPVIMSQMRDKRPPAVEPPDRASPMACTAGAT